MKKTIALLITIVMVTSLLGGVLMAAPQPITVSLDGENIRMAVLPTIDKDKVLLPAKATFEALGFKAVYSMKTKTYTITKQQDKIVLPINGKGILANKAKFNVIPALTPIKGDHLIPLETFVKLIKYEYDYDKAQNMISLYSSKVNQYLMLLVKYKVEDNFNQISEKINVANKIYTDISENKEVDITTATVNIEEAIKMLNDMKGQFQAIKIEDAKVKQANGLLIESFDHFINALNLLSEATKNNDAQAAEKANIEIDKAIKVIENWEKSLT